MLEDVVREALLSVSRTLQQELVQYCAWLLPVNPEVYAPLKVVVSGGHSMALRDATGYSIEGELPTSVEGDQRQRLISSI